MKKSAFLYCCILILLWGCGPSSENRDYAAGPVLTDKVVATEGAKAVKMPRKLIKNGSIRFRTDDTEATYDFVVKAIKKYDGYIADERAFNYKNSTGHEMTIRVPADNFDNLRAAILMSENIKKIEEKSTSITDVTEEFIDIEARLKVKKESEMKLLDLLKTSKNLTDVLKINEQLTNLRADIESIEGRLKLLENQVSFSTLNVSFSKGTKYSNRFTNEISEGFSEGWQIFLRLLTLLSYLWVIILAGLMFWWFIRYIRKRRIK
ncbi:MAG TPA: DUF4349 domain-containing protein [Prolixibacteraceae bacterium]|nr:DUF4349 domain-containing protein [Prolixibacteraceae bacterium]